MIKQVASCYMETNTDLKGPKLAYLPGFAERLQKTLDILGVRAHGRLTLLKQWSGLASLAGIKLLFDNDRPPKREAFEGLVNGILCSARLMDPKTLLSHDEISNYLLYGGTDPFGKLGLPTKSQYLDALQEAKIIVRVSAIAEKQGINILRDIDDRQRSHLINKVSDIVINKKISLDSNEMTELIKSLVNLAKSKVLI